MSCPDIISLKWLLPAAMIFIAAGCSPVDSDDSMQMELSADIEVISPVAETHAFNRDVHILKMSWEALSRLTSETPEDIAKRNLLLESIQTKFEGLDMDSDAFNSDEKSLLKQIKADIETR